MQILDFRLADGEPWQNGLRGGRATAVRVPTRARGPWALGGTDTTR
jgi:hypothetical protein